jgi:hypothetical protein
MSGAKMWPAALPASVREDRYRRAEVTVYDRLAQALGSDWTVFYSRPWLGLTPTGAERDGEADFVLANPKLGFLMLEVKGGGISYDPSTETWRSTDRNSVRHKIKNPFEQAKKAKYGLLEKLRQRRDWPQNRFVRVRHGVIFPDAENPPGGLGADMPRELICCRPGLATLGEWVRDRLTGGDEEAPGKDGVHVMERLLASPFTLRVPLGHVLDEDERAIDVLTPEQFHILDAVGMNPRVAAGGAAGAGKTIVAMEDAWRIAETGAKTLFTCLSEPLAEDIQGRMRSGDVDVRSFPDLCTELTRKAGLPARPFTDESGPDNLIEAVTRDPTLRYDAIIVDEAQDFRSHWWIALEALLSDPQTSRLHAYYDTNQSLYGLLAKELAGFSMTPVHLGRNLRNTKAIHATSAKFYRGLPVRAGGPDGVSVEWIDCEDARIADGVADVIKRLTAQEAVLPADIAVLAPGEGDVARLKPSLRSAASKGLLVDTIARFKGRERRVIVLAATRAMSDERELAYVGLSRARAHLIVLGDALTLAWLQGQEKSGAA